MQDRNELEEEAVARADVDMASFKAGQLHALEAIAPLICGRCEMQGPADHFDGRSDTPWQHSAYVTEDGVGIPPEPCAASAAWSMVALLKGGDANGR